MAEDIAGQDFPGGADRTPPKAPLGGHLAWWPFAVALGVAVALVTAVVLVNVLAGGGTTGSRQQGTGLTSSGAVACPEFFEHANTSWVPARPAGVHSRNKMVPKLHPTHVTVCRYPDRTSQSLRLAGQRELTGMLDRAIDTLRASPARATRKHHTCTAPTHADRYLIGMRYAEAIVWVAAPGPACGSGNGSFESARDLSGIAAASYAARTWVSTPN